MELIGTISVEMWGIVLGGTDSLLRLSLPYGYRLKRLKLKETVVADEIIKGNGKLDVKYLASNLASDAEPEFIFINRESEIPVPIECFTIEEMFSGANKGFAYIDEFVRKSNAELTQIIYLLRLIQEGSIEIAEKFYRAQAQYKVNKINKKTATSLDMPISVYGDLYELSDESEKLFGRLIRMPSEYLSIMNDLLERFSRGYSESKFDDAYKNLVTLAEMILIGYNSNDKSNKNKKIQFANRLSVAVEDEQHVCGLREDLLQVYKDRSDETHEGKNEHIDKTELKKLRCLLRRLLLNFIAFGENKYNNNNNIKFSEIKAEYDEELIRKVEIMRKKGYKI